MDDPKDESLLVLARAGGRLREGYVLLTFVKTAADDASVDQLGLEGAFRDIIDNLNDGLANFGSLVVGIFLVRCTVFFCLICHWQRLDRTLPKRVEA